VISVGESGVVAHRKSFERDRHLACGAAAANRARTAFHSLYVHGLRDSGWPKASNGFAAVGGET